MSEQDYAESGYWQGFDCARDAAKDEIAALQSERDRLKAAPIDMLLFCPACGEQHIDAPDERTPDWTNPPHKSHLCHNPKCRHIWRPCDRPTNGVAAIVTAGEKDGSPVPQLCRLKSRLEEAERLIDKYVPQRWAKQYFANRDKEAPRG